MKSSAFALLLASLVSLPATSWGAVEGIEDLLGVEATSEPVESPIASLLDSEFAPAEAATSEWHGPGAALPTPADVRGNASALASEDTAESDQSAAPGPVSYVPEPSALLLGVAALIYFLLFGRRRHLS